MNPIYGETLYHYGIRGQKWGKRRFQSYDGSLTPAGRSRFYAARKRKKVTKNVDYNGNPVAGKKKGKSNERTDTYQTDGDDAMREPTENLQKHSRINEHYESAVKAHMKEDSRYQEYRERAIEDYINSHLSSYDGNRQDMIDKMGDIDDYAMKLYMRDHKNDYFVKGYHATIGNKRTAEREFNKKAKEMAYPFEKQKKEKSEREAAKLEKKRESIQRQRNKVKNLRAQLSGSNLSVVEKLQLKNQITKLSNNIKSANAKLLAEIKKRNTPKVGATNETYADKISEAAKRRYFR